MPNVCLAAGLRLTVLIFLFFIGNIPAWGQFYDNPFDASKSQPFRFSPWTIGGMEDSMTTSPQSAESYSAGPATVSVDVLRHPISSKGRRLLEKAMVQAERGNHAAAIQDLRQALAKYPLDAAYTDNVLGLEYIETRQFNEAKTYFKEAARLMPNESCNHSNYGLSLAIVGELETAEKEERKALQLDSANSNAQYILEALLLHKRRNLPDSSAK